MDPTHVVCLTHAKLITIDVTCFMQSDYDVAVVLEFTVPAFLQANLLIIDNACSPVPIFHVSKALY